LFSAPVNKFNSETDTIHIPTSGTLISVAKEMKERKLVRSEFFLKSFVFLFKWNGKIDRGDYLFKRTSPVFSLAWQLAHGKHNIEPIKITLREGLTNNEMAEIFADKLTSFRRDIFFEKSHDKQGYLFPDTYFLFPMDTAEEVFDILSGNFQNQIKKVDNLIKENNRGLSDIITMASIIEKEASGEEDAPIISGILWKRIEKGMPLQVDAEKSTYQSKGLPASPICNPGLSSIKASLKPVDSPYLFYLHDKDGNVHFAKTFEEHKQNISKYLK
jgi:UPF0755 protein